MSEGRFSGIWLCQERYDVAFAVKELASRMSNPSYVISSLEEVPRIFEEGYGFLSSS